MNNDKVNVVKAILSGICIGGILASLTLYVSLKTGLMLPFLPLVAIVGFVLLRSMGSYSQIENTLSLSTATGCIIAIYGVSGAVVSLILFQGEMFSNHLFMSGMIISILASLMGIVISYHTREQWIVTEELAFPGGTAAAILIKSLGETGGNRFKVLSYGFLIGFIMYALVEIFGILPSNPLLFLGTPAFIGIEMSALAFGLGYIIGWRPSVLVFSGSVYSIVVWISAGTPAPSFGTHLFQPLILSVGSAFLVTASVVSLIQMRSTGISLLKRTQVNPLSFLKNSPVIVVIILISLLTLYLGVSRLHVSPLMGMLSSVFAVLAGIFCIKSAGETGILPAATIGMLILMVSALVLKDFSGTVFLAALVTQVGIICGFTVSTFKVGHIIGVSARNIAHTMTLGAVIGAPLGLGVLFILFSAYGFGTEELPSPGPVVWGATAQAIIQGGSTVVKASYALIASCAAVIMSYFHFSAISFGIGTIIPPSISATILLGGVSSFLLKKKIPPSEYEERHRNAVIFSSGLITGEGIAIVLFTLLHVLGII
ncbi:MAG: OPT/YSL family transporter [Theionarchaea archaeon]|nr:OPT/YSL family transporter [Theionarchaea archaeon]